MTVAWRKLVDAQRECQVAIDKRSDHGGAYYSLASIQRQVELIVHHMLELGRKSQQIGLVLDRSASMDDPFSGSTDGRVGETKSVAASRRITDFVHARSRAAICSDEVFCCCTKTLALSTLT